MSQVVIENPIINSPFDEPTRHFRFSDEGITNEIVEGRRTSSYFVPIAKPKKYGDAWIENALREANDTSNPGLPRIAFKMATGTTATSVAWRFSRSPTRGTHSTRSAAFCNRCTAKRSEAASILGGQCSATVTALQIRSS